MMMKSVLFVFLFVIGTTMGRSGLHSEESAPPARVQQCREGCLEKFATEDFACLQGPECLMSGFPTYNFYTFPDALHLLCWDQCAAPANKINTSILDTWPLKIISMVRYGSLVSTDIHWPLPPKDPAQCLVTWEIEGGGLMGNLLTDTESVELSLWPDTKYRIQVTCKNKVTETISRSLPLILDTRSALTVGTSSTTTTKTITSKSSTNNIESSSSINILSNEIIDDSNDNDQTNDINEAIQLHLNNKEHTISVWQKLLLNRNEIITGVCTSIIVFTVITIIVYVIKQNYFYYYNKLNICQTLSSSDNEKLIENSSCNNSNNNNNNVNNFKHNNSSRRNSNNNSNSCSNHSHNCINKQVYCDLQSQTIHV